jgi:hypothetical protein
MIAAIWILLPFAPTLSLARHTTQKSPVHVPPRLAVSPDSPSLALVSRYARYAEEALSQSRARGTPGLDLEVVPEIMLRASAWFVVFLALLVGGRGSRKPS